MKDVWKILALMVMVSGVQTANAGSWQPKEVSIQPPKIEEIPAQLYTTPLDTETVWSARIEYGIADQSVQITQQFASGDERGWSKPVFATLQHHFNGDDIAPYVGVGVGFAESLVERPSDVEEDALAFKGVFGTEMALEDGLGAFFEYGFAVAPKAKPFSANSIRSHSLTTGLSIDLN